jgi:N6-L-threonylcarbamoyladenine synthase
VKSGFEHVLAIETSCDDTSVAIVRADGFVVACLAANQDLAHMPFGGVVPEIASRNHTLQILPLIDQLISKVGWSWEKIDGIAVTSRPGLLGSLLVGVVTAKTLALVYGKPLLGVNHLEAHLLAPFLFDDRNPRLADLAFPYLALAVSGGHTQLYHVKSVGEYVVLGRTVDDAAGEAFDKFGKHLGLGFPAGVQVDRESASGNPKAYALPRTMTHEEGFDFSFSGLKSAGVRLIDSLPPDDRIKKRADLCASFQAAVVDTLMSRLEKAAEATGLQSVVLTGGVSANSRLRAQAKDWAIRHGHKLFVPPLQYCTDNAAMVGYAGIQRLRRGEQHGQNLGPSAASAPSDFREASR